MNEDLYDGLMVSINRVWEEFNLEEGTIDFEPFKQIMKDVAIDQGVFNGSEDQI